MDNCWDYHDGGSEIRMGKALARRLPAKGLPDDQDRRAHARAAAAKQIDESLQRLQTDHIDLMQFHENIRMEDPDRIFAAGGALEAVLAAKKAGKVRYIGFTGHKDPLVHLRMLDIAEQHNSTSMRADAAQRDGRALSQLRAQVMPVLVTKASACWA